MDDIAQSWEILRRKSRDDIPTTMNVAVAIERIIRAVNDFYDLCTEEKPKEYTTVRFISSEKGYKATLFTPFKAEHCGDKMYETLKALESNSDPWLPSVEDALEWLFLAIEAAFKQNYAAQEKAREAALKELEDLDSNLYLTRQHLKRMGHYDPYQHPLPLPDVEWEKSKKR